MFTTKSVFRYARYCKWKANKLLMLSPMSFPIYIPNRLLGLWVSTFPDSLWSPYTRIDPSYSHTLFFPYCLLTIFFCCYYNIVAVCYYIFTSIFIIVNSLLCMPLKYMQCKPIINFYSFFFVCYNPNYRAIFVRNYELTFHYLITELCIVTQTITQE